MSYRKNRTSFIPIPTDNYCKPKKPCGDTVRVSTEGVELTEDLECLDLEEGTKLTRILKEIDSYLCRLKDKVGQQGAFIINNIGTGAKLFKGVSVSGTREFKTLLTEDTSTLEITESSNEVLFKVKVGGGDSAYDIWLNEGNEGTEQDFIDSLKGEDGEPGLPGEDGEPGLDGDKGDKGDTGDTGPIGPDGEKGDQGDEGPQGIPGEKGDDGVDGEDGKQCLEYSIDISNGVEGLYGNEFSFAPCDSCDELQRAIGSDLDWDWLVDENTVEANTMYFCSQIEPYGLTPGLIIDCEGLCVGKDGEPGPKGEDSTIPGPKGEDGEKGDQGIPGPQGDNGEQGIQGDPGVDGEDGEKGDTGTIGETGEQGEPGEDGKDGEPGLPGEDGKDGEPGKGGAESEMKLASWTSWGEKTIPPNPEPGALESLFVGEFTLNFKDDNFVEESGDTIIINESGYYDISFNGLPFSNDWGKGYAESAIIINGNKNFGSVFGHLGDNERTTGVTMHTGVLKLFAEDSIKFKLTSLSEHTNHLKDIKVTVKKIRSHEDEDKDRHNGETEPI